ncbi:MAG: hypothetical protein IPQ13_10700 [Holophagaceae bacterium]|nr:hypothetical protein [Holophagaceae bacterium]
MRPQRIAILFHESDRNMDLSGYSIARLAPHWELDGHEVFALFGTGEFVPADLVIVHVDLSVVPEDYLAFAGRYPIALNGKVRDIRKSTFSDRLLRRGDDWQGPVIIKSDRNYAGHPELVRGIPRLDGKGLRATFQSTLDYKVFDRIEEVPEEDFDSPDLVVERFLPEMEDGLFHVRMYQFLGDRASCTRVGAQDPIVKSGNKVFSESVVPHPDIVAHRHRLNFDYGKLDYVIHNGEAILLDLNKTTGTAPQTTPQIEAIRHNMAEGLYSYFGT